MYSLSDKLLNEFIPEVESACKRLKLPFTTAKVILKKAELANFGSGPDNIDAAILVHRNEGRLLLTDENGLYNNLIRKEFPRLSSLGLKQEETCCSLSTTIARLTKALAMSSPPAK